MDYNVLINVSCMIFSESSFFVLHCLFQWWITKQIKTDVEKQEILYNMAMTESLVVYSLNHF